MDTANVRAAIADKLSTEHRRLKKKTDRIVGILNNNGKENNWICSTASAYSKTKIWRSNVITYKVSIVTVNYHVVPTSFILTLIYTKFQVFIILLNTSDNFMHVYVCFV